MLTLELERMYPKGTNARNSFMIRSAMVIHWSLEIWCGYTPQWYQEASPGNSTTHGQGLGESQSGCQRLHIAYGIVIESTGNWWCILIGLNPVLLAQKPRWVLSNLVALPLLQPNRMLITITLNWSRNLITRKTRLGLFQYRLLINTEWMCILYPSMRLLSYNTIQIKTLPQSQ
jgi:hypothetical protein